MFVLHVTVITNDLVPKINRNSFVCFIREYLTRIKKIFLVASVQGLLRRPLPPWSCLVTLINFSEYPKAALMKTLNITVVKVAGDLHRRDYGTGWYYQDKYM